MQLSSLIGKPVLSPAGEAYGYITAARPNKDLTKISCLVAADDEEEEQFIPMRAVLSLGDAVIVGKARLQSVSGVEGPIGKKAFAYTGEYLGTVCDLLLGDGSESILVLTKEGIRTTAAAACAVCGEHVVLYLDSKARDAAVKSAKRPSASPSHPRAAKERSKKPSPAMEKTPRNSDEMEARTEAEIPISTENVVPMPETKGPQTSSVNLLSRTDLLGRYVKRSVFDACGMPVALAGERITPAILARARRAGRLIALAAASLTVQ